MTDSICVFGAWVCYNPKRFEQCTENREKAEKFERYDLHLLSLEDVGVWGAINKLDAKLEAVTSKVKEWDNPHQRDKHAAPSILHELEGLLKLPQEGDEE